MRSIELFSFNYALPNQYFSTWEQIYSLYATATGNDIKTIIVMPKEPTKGTPKMKAAVLQYEPYASNRARSLPDDLDCYVDEHGNEFLATDKTETDKNGQIGFLYVATAPIKFTKPKWNQIRVLNPKAFMKVPR